MEKISLFLMSEKGLQVLNSLIENHFPQLISIVVIGKDKNVQNDYAAEIEELCKSNDIKYLFRSEEINIESKYAIAISWRWLIKLENTKLITLHDSILPKYRGFSPLVNSLIKCENEIGVTALFSSEKYDTGEIIYQEKLKVNYPIRIQEAIFLISDLYCKIVIKIFSNISKGERLISTPQNHADATYSLWRSEEDYLIDWTKSSNEILQFIYSVGFPYLGACARVNGETKVRILNAELVDDVKIENRDCGKVIFNEDQCPVVVCKDGLLKLTEVVYDSDKQNALPLQGFRIKFS